MDSDKERFVHDDEVRARHKDLMTTLRTTGVYDFPVKSFSEKWKVSMQTIKKDIETKLSEMSLPIIDKELKSLLLVYEKALSKATLLSDVELPVWVEPVEIPGEEPVDYAKRVAILKKKYLMERTAVVNQLKIATELMLQASEKYTSFLESFGLKEKQSEKIDVRKVEIKMNAEEYLKKVEHEGRTTLTADDVIEQ